jgi:hypothetical protein
MRKLFFGWSLECARPRPRSPETQRRFSTPDFPRERYCFAGSVGIVKLGGLTLGGPAPGIPGIPGPPSVTGKPEVAPDTLDMSALPIAPTVETFSPAQGLSESSTGSVFAAVASGFASGEAAAAPGGPPMPEGALPDGAALDGAAGVDLEESELPLHPTTIVIARPGNANIRKYRMAKQLHSAQRKFVLG